MTAPPTSPLPWPTSNKTNNTWMVNQGIKKQRKKIQNIPKFNSDDQKTATTLTNSPLQTLEKINN